MTIPVSPRSQYTAVYCSSKKYHEMAQVSYDTIQLIPPSNSSVYFIQNNILHCDQVAAFCSLYFKQLCFLCSFLGSLLQCQSRHGSHTGHCLDSRRHKHNNVNCVMSPGKQKFFSGSFLSRNIDTRCLKWHENNQKYQQLQV